MSKLRYETPEHQKAGNNVILKFLDNNGQEYLLPKDSKFTVCAYKNDTPLANKDLSLSYGQILALAGDYFAFKQSIATTDDPTEARSRFLAGFNQLASSPQQIINKIFRIGTTTYSKNSSLNQYVQQFLYVKLLGLEYFDNTSNNLDHFYDWSLKAYQAGHEAALQIAEKAYALRKSNNAAEANTYLQLAYQMNAFASHFLSDNFASGHLREGQLRVELSKRYGIIGSILINNMHNEDNRLGINVKNANEQWVAYGDGNYNRHENTKNKEIHCKALQESANEIFYTYKTGLKPESSKVNDLIPYVDNSPSKLATLHPQPAPLFIYNNNKVFYRNPLNELNPQKVQFKELSFFRAIILTLKMRVLPRSYAPKFTQKIEGNNGKNYAQLMETTGYSNDDKLAKEATPEPVAKVTYQVPSAPTKIQDKDVQPEQTFALR